MWNTIHSVKTIQIVVDSDLLRLADRTAKKLKTNRSALFRDALRAHLNRLDVQQKETRDRDGYFRHPDSLDEPAAWDKVADWPVWSAVLGVSGIVRRSTRSRRTLP
jgi:hypothetical protein